MCIYVCVVSRIIDRLAAQNQKNDYEFAFKVEEDYASVYEALFAMTEEDKWMIRNRVGGHSFHNRDQCGK